MIESVAAMNFACAVVCAKWALELGFSQMRQILFLIAGLCFGPLILFILYLYLIRKAKAENQEGAKWI